VPIVVLLTIDSGSTVFVLTAIALALNIAGPLLVSNRLAEPNYDVILDGIRRACRPGGRRSSASTTRTTGFAPSRPGWRSGCS